MNVTKDRFKDRQLHIEDYSQMVSAEQKEYAKVSDCQRIAENNNIRHRKEVRTLEERLLSETKVLNTPFSDGRIVGEDFTQR